MLPLRLLLVLCLSASTLCAQLPGYLKFERLTEEDGLSIMQTSCVAKDPRGFLWIGTINGLNFYDGRNFRIYRHRDNDPASIGGNFVEAIAFDAVGRMWVGTNAGISLYDERTGTFRNFDQFAGKSDKKWCHRLYFDKEGMLWFSCANGLGRMDPKTFKTETFRMFGPPEDFRVRWMIGEMLEDSRGNFWVGCGSGLFRFDKRTHAFTQLNIPCCNEPNVNCMGDNLVLSLFEDSERILWIGTWGGGLKRYDPRTGEFRSYTYDHTSAAGTCNIVRDIIARNDEYGRDLLWLGTEERGLGVFDKRTGEFRFFRPDSLDPNSISSIQAGQLFDDNCGTLWIATGEGICKVDRFSQRFNAYKVDFRSTDDSKWISFVISDRADPTGNTLWLGISFTGILKYNRATQQVLARYSDFPMPVPVDPGSASNISAMMQSRDGDIWFAGRYSVYRLHPASGRIESYYIDTSSSAFISHLAEDAQGNIWIASHSGLARFDPKTHATRYWRHDPKDPFSLAENLVTRVYIARDGRIWVGFLTKSIQQFDPATGRFTDHSKELPGSYAGPITEDRHGRIWAANSAGMSMYDPRTGISRFFGDGSGLPDKTVYEIIPRDNGMLWLATRAGLCCMNEEATAFTTYGKEDGLIRSYLEEAFSISGAGEIFIGFSGAIQSFFPDRMQPNTFALPASILGFRIFDSRVPFDRDSILQFPLQLSYLQNIITFEYGAPDFSHAKKNRYRYMLDGFDKAWVEAGGKMTATYTNLDGGDYVFKVMAANADGVWNEKPATFRIHVIPPFWKTGWFRATAALTIALLVFLLYRRSVNRVRKEERRKTEFNRKVADAEMKALRAQMNPHFIFNCMNTIDALVIQRDYEKASSFLNMFSRLIRMVLENSMHKLVTLETELKALEIYLQVERERFEAHFDYEILLSDDLPPGDYLVPPLLLQPYIENAILHGLRHKQEKGRIHIRLESVKEQLKVTIEDDGIGRERAAEIRERNRPGHRSLGMHVTNERIEIFNFTTEAKAEAVIEDLYDAQQQPCGTRVMLFLPLIGRI